MARIARAVAPGMPHRITQRGNRHQQTFFSDDDYIHPLLSLIHDDWYTFLKGATPSEEANEIRMHDRTGRPLGDLTFVEQLEAKLGRILKPQKPGRKPKPKQN